jgi:hypothetical protein
MDQSPPTSIEFQSSQPFDFPLPCAGCMGTELPVGSRLSSVFLRHTEKEGWFDWENSAERVSTKTTYPGSNTSPAQTEITNSGVGFAFAKEKWNLEPATSFVSRYLNPCAVLADWSHSRDVRLIGRQPYRDYVRIVLSRTTADGEQRLFLDPKIGFPVKVEFQEKHYCGGNGI